MATRYAFDAAEEEAAGGNDDVLLPPPEAARQVCVFVLALAQGVRTYVFDQTARDCRPSWC